MTCTHRRHRFLVLLLAIFVMPLVASAQEVPELQINSTRYIVINADTGEVYAQRDANDQVAIASLTKVFTAVQAVNMASLDTRITTKESDLQPAEATTMGFGPGETYTLRDLIYGMMLPSGNDAAYAIARHLGYQDGDTDEQAVQRFMDLLNQRIENMGLENTHLENPDGWGVPGHYSTAADVAAFMQYASEYPFIVEVMGTSSYTTSNGAITVTNTNKILNSYAPLVAGKTGYDWDSGWCLVTLAETGDARMIAVTLDGVAPDDWYDDNMVLLEHGFDTSRDIRAGRESFDGDIVTWSYPDAAELAASSERRTSVVGERASTDLPQAANGDDGADTTGQAGEGIPFEPASAGPILAGIAALGLIGLRAASHWRHTGGTGDLSGIRRLLPLGRSAPK